MFIVTLTSYVGPELLVDEEERRQGKHERGVVSGDFAALLEAEKLNGRLAMVGAKNCRRSGNDDSLCTLGIRSSSYLLDLCIVAFVCLRSGWLHRCALY